MQKNCLGYPVEFAEDAFGDSDVLAKALAKTCGDGPKVLIVADMNVVQRTPGLGSKIGRYVQAHGLKLAGSPVVLQASEKIKADSLQSVLKIVSAMLEAKLGRTDVVMVLGGGSLLDVTAYAASQVRGGVRLVRVPTTPAAMMDAAFADYAAVDSANVKDALRVSSVPAFVLIDPTLAQGVLDGVWNGGVGEAIRLAAACDAALLKKIEALTPDYRKRDLAALGELARAVAATRQKKGSTGLGLWAAHRLESMSGYKLPHGYAVPIGLLIDLNYAVERGLAKAEARDRVLKVMLAGGVLEGLSHSRHLVAQSENLLFGLDAWRLTSPSGQLPVFTGVGKSSFETETDRALFLSILKNLNSFPVEGQNLVK